MEKNIEEARRNKKKQEIKQKLQSRQQTQHETRNYLDAAISGTPLTVLKASVHNSNVQRTIILVNEKQIH